LAIIQQLIKSHLKNRTLIFGKFQTPHIVVLFFCLIISISAFAQADKLSEGKRKEFDRLFFEGLKEKVNGNLVKAEEGFVRALNLDPDNANVHFHLAQIYLHQKNLAGAEPHALQATLIDKKNTWYKSLLAEIYRTRREFQKAAALYEEIYSLDKDYHMLFEVSLMHMMTGKDKQAIKALNRAEKVCGITEELITRKEDIYLYKKNYKAAVKEVKKLIKTFPKNTSYQGRLADLYLAQGKEKEALDIYNSIIKAEPENGYVAFALSDYYKYKNEQQKHIEYFKKGMSSPSMDMKIKVQELQNFIIADSLSAKRKLSREIIDDFIKSNPEEAAPYLFMADILLMDSAFEDARKNYLLSVSIQPDSYQAWRYIILCDQEMSDFNNMKNDSRRAIDIFPADAFFYNSHSMAAMQIKDYADAVWSSRTALEIITDADDLKIQFLSTLGDAAHYNKEYKTSDSAYNAILEIDSRNAYALNNYAYFLSLRNENLDKADSMSKLSLEISPGNSSYLDTYGWILYKKKDFINAKFNIEKSLEQSTNSAEVNEHYGDVLYKLGSKAEALKYWNKAKQINGGNEKLDKKIKDEKLYE